MTEETHNSNGVYELVIGLTAEDEATLIQYWEQFGFTVGKSGSLNAKAASQLYGVNSNLRSLRLHNVIGDRSSVRLMVWDEPVNQGLGLTPLKVVGSRWGTALSLDVFNVANHASDAIAAGLDVYYVPPQRNLIRRPEAFQPFVQVNPCVHEMVLIQPLTRQVLFQRHDYTRSFSGFANRDSHFQASEFIHVGISVDCDKQHLDFYEQVMGWTRTTKDVESKYSQVSRLLLELKGSENGERMFEHYFTAPVSSNTDNSPVRLGANLEVLRFEGTLPNKLNHSRPGSLGVSLYTSRVHSIESYYQQVSASTATEITQVCENEFGEPSFSFVAPDGYFWTLLQ
ncbi:MAG: VOC family protein [Nostocaceae cyanobacterium]|nr:VOC family protein [Nostocaceae cyanobacterium]